MFNNILKKPYSAFKKVLLKKINAHPLEIALSQNDKFSIPNFIPLFIDYIEKNESAIMLNPEKIRSMLMVKMYHYNKVSTIYPDKNIQLAPHKFFYPCKDKKKLNNMMNFSAELDHFFCNHEIVVKYKSLFEHIFANQNKTVLSVSSSAITFDYFHDFLFLHIKNRIETVLASDVFNSYWQKQCLSDTLSVENKIKPISMRL